jgi:hypothetical protein
MFRSSSSVLQCESLEAREVPATIFAVNSAGRLLTFDSNNPSVLLAGVSITGLATAGERITEIDVRPGNGLLYGRSNFDRLYTINPLTGTTSPIGGVVGTAAAHVGMDFDPVADSLRVVSNARENLSLDPDTGGVASFGVPLSYRAGDIAQGLAPRVTALAATNSIPFALTTTIYGIDHARNTLVRFAGLPDAGRLATVGSLGFDVTALVGFDIEPGSSLAFATVRVPGSASSLFCQINLQTGAATIVGSVGNGRLISDVAVTRGGSFVFGSVFVPPTPTIQPSTQTTVPTSPLTPTLTQPLAPTLTQPLAPGTVAPTFGTTFGGSSFTFGSTSSTFDSFDSFSLF